MLNFQITLNTHCGLYLALKVSLEKGGLFFVRVTLRYVPHIWRDRQDDTGQVTTMIPGTPEGFNKLCFLNVTLPFDKPAYRIGGLHSLKFTKVLKSNGLWITSQSNYIRRFS